MPWKYVTSSLLLEGGANSWDLECWSLGSAALDITLEGQPSWWGGGQLAKPGWRGLWRVLLTEEPITCSLTEWELQGQGEGLC